MPLTYSPNAQYNLAKANSLPVRIAARARRRMYQAFLYDVKPLSNESLLDVGVTSDETYEASNYLESWYPYKECITGVGLDDSSSLPMRFPGMKYVKADGRQLPFTDNSFDVVHSSAVLEHVGSALDQQCFLQELVRVARRAVFVTTPNRWFPIEFHSMLPFVHWLPSQTFRSLLRNTRYEFFSYEENLNLLGKKEVLQMCSVFVGCRVAIATLKLLGLSSNILVTIHKSSGTNV